MVTDFTSLLCCYPPPCQLLPVLNADTELPLSLALRQVMSDSKSLLEILQTPVSSSVNNAIIAQADYRLASNHVLDLIHQILERNKEIENAWSSTRSRLNQKLGLRIFQKDVQQVPYPHPPRYQSITIYSLLIIIVILINIHLVSN